MTITELNDYLLINSLQYFIGPDDIEVTQEVLNGLIQRALTTYSQWRPLFYQTTISLTTYVTEIKFDDQNRRIQNITNIYYFEPILSGESGSLQFDWDYNKDNGQFRSGVTGTFIAEVLVSGSLADYDTNTIELMDLIQALYMMYIGSSRKAFTFGEQPFENDGSELYSDGKELWDNTLESLKNEQDNWYLSIM